VSRTLFFLLLVGWPAVVFAALTGRIGTVSSALSVSEYAGWFFVAGAPVATWLMILRGRPGKSIAQVLYDTERLPDSRG
jgi:hypothetical protein